MRKPVGYTRSSSERGETLLSVVVCVAIFAVGWFVFFAVKDWIKDAKDRRDGGGEYREVEREIDGPHEPAGYSITFYP